MDADNNLTKPKVLHLCREEQRRAQNDGWCYNDATDCWPVFGKSDGGICLGTGGQQDWSCHARSRSSIQGVLPQ